MLIRLKWEFNFPNKKFVLMCNANTMYLS
jgi:hypothetical protein